MLRPAFLWHLLAMSRAAIEQVAEGKGADQGVVRAKF
jgi:hypothetical protein